VTRGGGGPTDVEAGGDEDKDGSSGPAYGEFRFGAGASEEASADALSLNAAVGTRGGAADGTSEDGSENDDGDGEVGLDAQLYNVLYGLDTSIYSAYEVHSRLEGVCGEIRRGCCRQCSADKPAYASICDTCGYLDAALGGVCTRCNLVTDRFLADGQPAPTCRFKYFGGCPGEPSLFRNINDEDRASYLQARARDPGCANY